ncbi:hypothetical protein L6164_033442 [Bauhinia variegata]|uniref:Uncharacterized protein n=1 Tax=Bauhinia variegata TaxID=167791 RepID=A0ACB9KRW0_BAUVA|nr:hypothetical protein L6164_033442 [Bauhinia variegata]
MSLKLFWVLMFIMEKTKILNLITLALAFLALLTKMESSVVLATPRPLCGSQFALANYACATLPHTPGTPPSPPSPPPPSPSPPSPPDDDDDDNVKGHGGRHGHGHGHGNHGHDHGNQHRRGHHHRHQLTSQEENCCRWAREVDSQCVCEILLRLPPFLVRPVHDYTVKVGDMCDVTYSCGGPL